MSSSANKRLLTSELIDKVGETVTVKGWVNSRRDHGKLLFLDLRDRSGLLQLVLHPQISESAHAAATDIRDEFVIEVTGEVVERQERLINPNLVTGKIELAVKSLTILNKAETLPFTLEDTKQINEETRLKYRYLDLRSERMAKNMRLRDKVKTIARNFFGRKWFCRNRDATSYANLA